MKANKRTLRNVILFCFVAVVCGWVGVGVDKLLGQPSNLESLGALIFISSPILCMVLLRLFGGDGWKDLPLKPNFRRNTRWYLFPCCLSCGHWHNVVCRQAVWLGGCKQV